MQTDPADRQETEQLHTGEWEYPYGETTDDETKLKIPQKHKPDLERARLVAELKAMDGRLVSIDDVKQWFEEEFQRPLAIGNSMGKLFKDGHWLHAGYCRSRSPKANGRVVQTWQLLGTRREHAQPFDVGVANGERICSKCGVNVEQQAEHACEERIQ